MQIVSNFRDFYDCMQGLGIDKCIRYERETDRVYKKIRPTTFFKDSTIKFIRYSSKFIDNKWKSRSTVRSFLLLAGKSYPFIFTSVDASYFWTYSDYEEYYLNKHDMTLDEVQAARRSYSRTSLEREQVRDQLSRAKDHFNSILPEDKIIMAHQLLESPIILMNDELGGDQDWVTINSCLKDIGFSKILQPHEVFQDLSMFIGSVLNPEKDLVEISDKDKIAAHGFDEKSFRHRS